MPSPQLSALRLVGRLEAISFLVLLGFAMPMKYLADRPEFVKWIGWAHGVLFVGYAWLVFWAWLKHNWPLARPIQLGIAALVPFGPFLIEKRLEKWEAEGK